MEGGLQRPKLELNIKYDKDEEKARLKKLLREGPARLCEYIQMKGIGEIHQEEEDRVHSEVPLVEV